MKYLQILKNEKNFLIFLFLFSLVVRYLVFYFYLGNNQNYWQVDSNTYHLIAKNIVLDNGISADGQNPNFYRLPGYPVFLSIFYKLFNFSIYKTLLFQILIASFIPILIFFLALSLFKNNIILAKLSSFYSSLHLGFILYSGFFMSETLFIFFLLLFFILFFRQNSKLNNTIFFAGIFLGVASLIRPVGHYLIILSSLMILFLDQSFFKIKIKKILLLFVGWLSIVFAWILRNYLLTGFIFFHTLPGGHFLYFSAARIVTHINNCSYDKAKELLFIESQNLIKQKEFNSNRKLTEIEESDIKLELAIKYFKEYPLITLKNWSTDILRTGLSLYSSELVFIDNNRVCPDYFNKDRTILSLFKKHLLPDTKNNFLKIIIYFEIITFLFILLGFLGFIIFSFLDKNNFLILLKVLPFVVLFIFIGLSGGYSRMRLPIEPFLIILTVSFWQTIFKISFCNK